MPIDLDEIWLMLNAPPSTRIYDGTTFTHPALTNGNEITYHFWWRNNDIVEHEVEILTYLNEEPEGHLPPMTLAPLDRVPMDIPALGTHTVVGPFIAKAKVNVDGKYYRTWEIEWTGVDAVLREYQMGTLEARAFENGTEVAATVEVVGVETYTTPFSIPLDPGEYTLNASYADYPMQTKTVTIVLGFTTIAKFYFGAPPGPCFIATAAFGTPLAKELVTLRRFRDTFMLRNWIGRFLVQTYYTLSPPVARLVEKNTKLRFLIRRIIAEVLSCLK